MLNIKNIYIKFLMTISLVMVPALSFAMEDGDGENSRRFAEAPYRMVRGLKNGAGLVVDASVKGATYVAELAYEHPIVTVCTLGGCVVTYKLLSYLATQKDLDNTGKALTEHRVARVQQFVQLEDKHERATTAKFIALDQRQDKLVLKLDAVDGNITDVQLITGELSQQVALLKQKKLAALAALQVITRENVETSKQCGIDLRDRKRAAIALAEQLEKTAQETEALLQEVDAEDGAAEGLLLQLRQNGAVLQQAETDVAAIAARFKAMSDQLEAARQQQAGEKKRKK